MSIAEQVGKALEEQNVKLNYLSTEEGGEPVGFVLPVAISNLGIQLRIVVTYEQNNVSLRCFGIGRVGDEKKEVIFALLNELNRYYRWTQIFVENDGNLVLQADQYFLEEAAAADITRQTVGTIIQICADVYPKLMSGLWGKAE